LTGKVPGNDYAGKCRNWSDGTPIRLILLPLGDRFSVYLASINPYIKSASEKAPSISDIFIAMTDQEAAEKIEKTSGSLGTASACLVAVEKIRIEALSVDGTTPALSNIADGVHIFYRQVSLHDIPQQSCPESSIYRPLSLSSILYLRKISYTILNFHLTRDVLFNIMNCTS